MSATLAPFGLRPCYHPTGLDRVETYTIATGYASNIFKNSPVYLVTATSTLAVGAAAGATGDLLGSFQGVEYFDLTGKPTYSNFWPASLNTLANSVILAYVIADPIMVFEIQADGSVPQLAVGKQVNFSVTAGYLFGSGSTFTGQSSTGANATYVASGSQGALRVIGFGLAPDNAVGDAFTVLRVQIAQSQYIANKVGV